MNPLEMLGQVMELAKFDDNKYDEIKQIKKTLIQIEAYQRGVEISFFDDHCKVLQEDLMEEVQTTKQVIEQAGTKSTLFQRLRSILPNNILEQLREQNQKLNNELKAFREYYEMIQSRNNLQSVVPQRPEPTLIEPDNQNYQQTLVDPDDQDTEDNSAVKLNIKFKFCGDEDIQSLFKKFNISIIENLDFSFNKISVGENQIYEFGRQKYEKLKEDLPKIVGSISNVHLKIYINKKKEYDLKEEQEEEQKENKEKKESNQKEKKQQQPVFATVVDDSEDDDQNQNQQEDNKKGIQKLNQEHFEIFVENLSANGTYLYLNQDQGNINAFSWSKIGKGEKAQLLDGDKFAINVNKKDINEVYIAYQLNVNQ